MPMQNERVHAIKSGNLAIGITIRGCLNRFARGTVRCVKPLLAQNDTTGLALIEQLRTLQVIGEHLKVLERDPRSCWLQKGALVVPEPGLEQILRIGMVCHMPVEVALIILASTSNSGSR